MRLMCLPFFCAALLGCAGSGSSSEPPDTAGSVDLQRYQGTWYEQARLPMFFQRDCAQSEAHYSVQANGAVGVKNRCRTADGEWKEAIGQATPQVAGRTDKLWVQFDNWFSNLFPSLTKGDYWVLYVDEDYRTAVVGHPNREYLWLLTRDKQITPQTRERMLQQATARGYNVDELIWRTSDTQIKSGS